MRAQSFISLAREVVVIFPCTAPAGKNGGQLNSAVPIGSRSLWPQMTHRFICSLPARASKWSPSNSLANSAFTFPLCRPTICSQRSFRHKGKVNAELAKEFEGDHFDAL